MGERRGRRVGGEDEGGRACACEQKKKGGQLRRARPGPPKGGPCLGPAPPATGRDGMNTASRPGLGVGKGTRVGGLPGRRVAAAEEGGDGNGREGGAARRRGGARPTPPARPLATTTTVSPHTSPPLPPHTTKAPPSTPTTGGRTTWPSSKSWASSTSAPPSPGPASSRTATAPSPPTRPPSRTTRPGSRPIPTRASTSWSRSTISTCPKPCRTSTGAGRTRKWWPTLRPTPRRR